jgi:site-specific DNA recombinase
VPSVHRDAPGLHKLCEVLIRLTRADDPAHPETSQQAARGLLGAPDATEPCYKGDVIYPGTHEPLVPTEVWHQVQSVLTSHTSAAEATQIHDHDLKGTVFCGACGSRLIASNAKNRHGNVYPYFAYSGRHSKRTGCTRQAILVEDVEAMIERYYQRVQITPARREARGGMLHHEFDRLMADEADELAQLTGNRDRFLQVHYADALPLSLLKREQDRILGELDQVNRRVDAHRRLCNQAFFTKTYVEEDDELRVERQRPYEMLTGPEVNANALTWAENSDKARTPALVSKGRGSGLVPSVPQEGVEPPTKRLEGSCSIH